MCSLGGCRRFTAMKEPRHLQLKLNCVHMSNGNKAGEVHENKTRKSILTVAIIKHKTGKSIDLFPLFYVKKRYVE